MKYGTRYYNEYDGKRTDYCKNTRSIKIIEKKNLFKLFISLIKEKWIRRKFFKNQKIFKKEYVFGIGL